MTALPLLKSLIRGAWRRRIIMMVPLLVIVPAALVAAFLWPTKYETSTLVLLQEYSGLTGDQPGYQRAQDMRDKVKSLEALVTSEFILRRIMKQFAKDGDQTKEPTEKELEDYRKRLSLEQVGDQFIQLKLQGPSRDGLSNELSAIMASLFESLLSSNKTSLNAPAFVARTRQQELALLEEKLRTTASATGTDPGLILQKTRLEAEATRTRINALTTQINAARQQLDAALSANTPDLSLAATPANETVEKLKTAISELQSNPDAEPVNSSEHETRQNTLGALLAEATALVSLEKEREIKNAELVSLQTEITKAGSLVAQRSAWQKKANDLRSQYQVPGRPRPTAGSAADIQLLRAPAQIQVIDTPKDPKRPLNSRLLIFLTGCVGALALSVAFGVLAEELDDTLRSDEMLQEATTVPTIAQFPWLNRAITPMATGNTRQLRSQPSGSGI